MGRICCLRGVSASLPKDRRRIHRRTIVIDESGDLGSSSSYFIMTAAVIRDFKEFIAVGRRFPPSRREHKYRYADNRTRTDIIWNIDICCPDIYYNVTDKILHPTGSAASRKKMYFDQLVDLIEVVLRNDTQNTYDILIDENSLISGDEDKLVEVCMTVATSYKKRIEWFEMTESSGNKALQVHDYIAGAVGCHIEHNGDPGHECHELYRLIEQRIKTKRP